jgi:hypothetical protein
LNKETHFEGTDTKKRNNVTIDSDDDNSLNPISKLDRTDATKYNNVFIDTVEGSSTATGGGRQKTLKRKTHLNPLIWINGFISFLELEEKEVRK